jgi:hypothetical protein
MRVKSWNRLTLSVAQKRPMHRNGRFVLKGRMGPFVVIDVHGLFDRFCSLLKVRGSLSQELVPEDAVDPLCQGVLVVIVAVGHRAAQTVALLDGLVVARTVLGEFNRSSHRREIERLFWEQIATGITSERAAEAVGVSQAVGARWFRYCGGMPLFMSNPISGRYLSFAEPEEIGLLSLQGVGVREIPCSI